MFYSRGSGNQVQAGQSAAASFTTVNRESVREKRQKARDGSGLKCAVLTAAACKQRRTPASLSASACLLRGGERWGVSQPCLYSNQRERKEPKSVFKDNLTLCNHSCLGFDLREGREKIITCFWVPFYNEWKTMLDLNRMVMGGCLCECDGEVLNATWGK